MESETYKTFLSAKRDYKDEVSTAKLNESNKKPLIKEELFKKISHFLQQRSKARELEANYKPKRMGK